MIDQASVFASKYKSNPQILQATVLGQGPDPSLDPYTALRALQLIKESNAMQMAQQAQGPTSAPSLASQAVAPQGLAAMVPMGAPAGQMPQGMPPQGQMPQGMPPQQAPQAPVMQASGGLAGMYTPEEDYAAGGIVAFSGEDESLVSNAAYDDPLSRATADTDAEGTAGESESEGNPSIYEQLSGQFPGAVESVQNFTAKRISPAEYKKIQADEIKAYRDAMGPNTALDALRADIEERKGERDRSLEEGKGVALLKAAAAMVQGNNWARAFAGAGAAFGDEYNRALKADKAEKRSLALVQFNIADAERKERMGLFKEGRAAADRAVTENQAAEKARFDKTSAVAEMLAKGMTATKPPAKKTGDAGTKFPQVDRQTAVMQDELVDLQVNNPNDPKIPVLEKKIAARIAIISAGKEGPTVASRAAAALTAQQNNQANDRLDKWSTGTEATKARLAGTYEALRVIRLKEFQEDALRGVFDAGGNAGTNKGGEKTTEIINYDANGKRIK
jgi:hypothetical protein